KRRGGGLGKRDKEGPGGKIAVDDSLVVKGFLELVEPQQFQRQRALQVLVAVDLDGMMIQDRVHFSDRAAVIIGNAPHALVDDQVLALLIHGRKAYHLPRALRTRMRRSRSCTTLPR